MSRDSPGTEPIVDEHEAMKPTASVTSATTAAPPAAPGRYAVSFESWTEHPEQDDLQHDHLAATQAACEAAPA